MDSILSSFLLFLAAIVALLSYALLPSVPVSALMTASAIALAVGVWWHWTQFAVEYRTSTWQEQLRSYGSYVMVITVILLSYAFYLFVVAGPPNMSAARNASANALSRALSNASNAIRTTSSNIFIAPVESISEGINSGISNINRGISNVNRSISNIITSE